MGILAKKMERIYALVSVTFTALSGPFAANVVRLRV